MQKILFAVVVMFSLSSCNVVMPAVSLLQSSKPALKLPDNFPQQVFSDQTISNGGRRVGIESTSGNSDIWVTNMDGSSALIQLTETISNDYSPVWSPDGLRIAFVSERDNNPEIYVMNADGTEQTRLTNNAVIDAFPAWSPDGKYIAFMSKRDGNPQIYTMSSNGILQMRVTNDNADDTSPAWSLDGQFIVYISAPTENDEGNIYIIKPDGTGLISYIDFAIPDKSVLPFDPNGKKKNCSAFKTQIEAQLFFIAAGGPLRDRHELDGGGVKGVACESLP
jgi:Tol biopolymer transport system component